MLDLSSMCGLDSLPGHLAEVGIIHYNTPFNKIPGFIYTGTVPLVSNHYGMEQSWTQLWLGAWEGMLSSFIDYVIVGPNNNTPSRLEGQPYPIAIIEPGDGIVVWNPTQGFELKVGVWIRGLAG